MKIKIFLQKKNLFNKNYFKVKKKKKIKHS